MATRNRARTSLRALKPSSGTTTACMSSKASLSDCFHFSLSLSLPPVARLSLFTSIASRAEWAKRTPWKSGGLLLHKKRVVTAPSRPGKSTGKRGRNGKKGGGKSKTHGNAQTNKIDVRDGGASQGDEKRPSDNDSSSDEASQEVRAKRAASSSPTAGIDDNGGLMPAPAAAAKRRKVPHGSSS